MVLDPSRRRLLGGVALGTAAIAGSGATAAAASLLDQASRSDTDNAIGDRVPGGRRPRGAHVVWSVATSHRGVALTFDDGPDPELTPLVLSVLAAADAHATFFMVGEAATRRPDLVGDVVAAGHEIGSHTWSHTDLARADRATTTRQIVEGHRAIAAAAGRPLSLFRPPWGDLTGGAVRVAAELALDVVLWSHSAEHLPAALVPGDVILLHDGVRTRGGAFDAGHRGAVRARHRDEIGRLPQLLRRLRDADIEPTTVGALLDAP